MYYLYWLERKCHAHCRNATLEEGVCQVDRGTHGDRAILIPDTPQTQIPQKSLLQTQPKITTEYADLLLFIKNVNKQYHPVTA